MKDGYYLATYFFINDLAYLTGIELRHDMNMSLWKKDGNKIKLIRYWELERVTGFKQHRKAFYSVEHAKYIINQLLSEFHLSMDDMIEVWGTPQLDTCNDYHSLEDYNEFCYHSICHLFSSMFLDSTIFYQEKILSLAVDGVPDNVLDMNIEDKNYYTACISEKGEIKSMYEAYSPGVHWGFIRDYYNMREGSLMALASASNSVLYDRPLKLIFVHNKDKVAEVIDDVTSLIKYVEALTEKDAGVLFSGFDSAFSEKENKISMVVKEVQKLSLLIMEKNIEHAITDYGLKVEETYLSLSGGFALNCPSNSHIMKKYHFKGFFAPPCVNDSGISLGVALYGFYKKMEGKIEFKFKNAYYGEADNKFTDMIEKYDEYIENISEIDLDKAVEDIIKHPIVWFHGNSEIGPRALGNRSIIADPRNISTKDKLNEIKQRQWWRPVAPIVLEEEVEHWFEDAYPTKFMLHTFQMKEDKKIKIPAVLHVDGSARIQTLNRKDNKELYNLLKVFMDRTGVPILCNTSLNDKGEPIINTLEEMMNFCLRKKIKVAYVNGRRILLKNHETFHIAEVAPRKINFNKFVEEIDQEQVLKRLNPYALNMELLTVYIQNPILYKKVDLRSKESSKLLTGILKLRKGKFHIL